MMGAYSLNKALTKACVVVVLFTACSSSKENKESSESAPEVKFADAGTSKIFKNYLALKNALLKSDAQATKVNAALLQTSLAEAKENGVALLAEKIVNGKDIQEQRVQLDTLTKATEKIVRAAKLQSGVVYKQFCPMANEGKGGYWLAVEADIKNPYYGAEMLECGEVTEEIK